MEKSLTVKIQYFADLLTAQIMEIENVLVSLDMTKREEENAVLKSKVLNDILKRYEDLFEDVVYRDDED